MSINKGSFNMHKILISVSLILFLNSAVARTLLVSTDWLAKNLSSPDIILIDMSDGFQYQRFHLPGAINLPYQFLNQEIKGVSLSIGQGQIVKLLGQLGVSATSHVVLYDDTGGLNASRLYWELEQLGHKKVSILDGGLVKWIREQRKVSAETPKLKPANYIPTKSGNPATASLDDVKAAVQSGKTLLLDVRTQEEYLGNPRYKRSGHIPGANWWEWDQAVDFDGGFTLHEGKRLLESLAGAGLKDKKQDVIVYCRSGHRASSAYLTLRELGFENVKLYDASMKEYEQIPTLPLKLGKEP